MYELNDKQMEQVNGGWAPVAMAFAEAFAVGITIGDWVYDNFDEEILDAIEYVDNAI